MIAAGGKHIEFRDVLESPRNQLGICSDELVVKLCRMSQFSDRRSRLWLMRTLAVALSLTPLIVVELIFRSIETPVEEALDRDPLVDLSQLKPLFERNEGASGECWEIPESRLNFFRPDSFLAEKPAGLRRIFVLGGSTVQGRPYAIETAFSTWLRLRLEANQPQTRFEVVNCGGISYASYRVAKILDEVLEHKPDAIVIYTGHNEFLEDREYAEVREMGALRRSVATVAGEIATVRWIRRALLEPPPQQRLMPGEVDARLDHRGGLDRYHRDEQWKTGVERHFELTLQRMVQRVHAAGVPLVLCVPASDLVRTPPFKVEPPADSSDQSRRELADLWEQARDVDISEADRIQAAEDCLAIDPKHAGAHYLLGRNLFERGEANAARSHLTSARDHDVCPLRATASIMRSVANVATEQQIPLIMTPELLDQRDWLGQRRPDGIPDPGFFVDHLHPSVSGHQRIGEAIADALVAMDWVRQGDDESDRRYAELVEQQMSGLKPGYFARGRQRLEGLRQWAAGRAGQELSDLPPSAP